MNLYPELSFAFYTSPSSQSGRTATIHPNESKTPITPIGDNMLKLIRPHSAISFTIALIGISAFLILCYCSYLNFLTSAISERSANQATTYADTLLFCILPPLLIIATPRMLERYKQFSSSWYRLFGYKTMQPHPNSRTALTLNAITSFIEALCALAALVITLFCFCSFS